MQEYFFPKTIRILLSSRRLWFSDNVYE